MKEVPDAKEPWRSLCLQQLSRVYGGGEKGMYYTALSWFTYDEEDCFYPGTTLWVSTNTLRHLWEFYTETGLNPEDHYEILNWRSLPEGLRCLIAWYRK